MTIGVVFVVCFFIAMFSDGPTLMRPHAPYYVVATVVGLIFLAVPSGEGITEYEPYTP